MSNFRQLTDIRFKLLAFLPLVAAAGFAAAGVGQASGSAPGLMAGIFLFGFFVTVALATYNARNDQIYVFLVERAAEIERRLGLVNSSFAHRPNAWLSISLGPLTWHMGHRRSISLLYGISAAFWLTGALIASAQAIGNLDAPPWWVYLAAVITAATATVAVGKTTRSQAEARRGTILRAAATAIDLATQIQPGRTVPADATLRTPYSELVDVCVGLSGNEHSADWREEELWRRIHFFAAMPEEERALHGIDATADSWAVNYVASLVDLPPSMLLPVPRRR